MGHANAKHAAKKLIADDVDYLISFGTAAAISPELGPGDLLLPEEVFMNGDTFDIHSDLQERLKHFALENGMTVNTSPLLTINNVITSKSEKIQLSRQTRAWAVDMETAIIVKQAREKAIPVLAVRIIIDTLEVQVPELVLKHTDEFGKLSVLSFLLALLTKPGQIPDLLHIARAYSYAAKAMKLIGQAMIQTCHTEQSGL